MCGDDDQDSGPGDREDVPTPGDTASDEGGELIRMADFETLRPEDILTDLRRYWDSLRNGRAIPARADVDPRGMRRSLDHAFILERIAPGAARFRLAGRHLIDLMGMEVRGMPLSAILNPPSRGRLSDVLESVFRAPQIAELHLLSPDAFARPPLTAQMLLLPLRSDLGDVTRVLGCIASEGEIGRTPRRFDIRHDQVLPVIKGGEVLEPSPSAAGFAEPPAPWVPQDSARLSDETPQERRARFRIVADNTRPDQKPPKADD